jgi:methionyl-tRNA formyltransferase
MRLMLLVGPGAHHRALGAKLAEQHEVVVFVESRNRATRPSAWTSARRRIANRTVGRPLAKAWSSMQQRYANTYSNLSPPPDLVVDDINASAALQLARRADADLTIVSGTNLLRPPTIAAATKGPGILNLHTGISPYVKGGPNCTNWCLARGWWHLIGSSVMWIDAGVDTGRLLVTERAAVDRVATLEALHWEVMEHAHDLVRRSVDALAAGHYIQGTPQDQLGDGVTFYTRDWNEREMLRALRGFRQRPRPTIPDDVRLVSLPGGR